MNSDLISLENLNIEKKESKNPHDRINQKNFIEIDGSMLEGGGQILRISLSLGALFNKETSVYKIRGSRPKPGLQQQHYKSLETLEYITNSKVEGLAVNSQKVILKPGNSNKNETKFKCECSSAGSVGLMIQAIMTNLLFFKNETDIDMSGGTVVSHAPATFYLQNVLKKILNKMGIDFNLNVTRHGLFPVGGGVMKFNVLPVKFIQPINIIERGKLLAIKFKLASTNNFKIINLEAMYKSILKEIKKNLHNYTKNANSSLDENSLEEIIKKTTIEYEYISLYTMKNTFTLFGEILMEFENTTVEANYLFSSKKEDNEVKIFERSLLSLFENYLFNDKICLDEYTVDHLIIFMALAKGRSKISLGNLSTHTITAIELIKIFIPDIDLKITKEENSTLLEIEGIGWINENIQ